MKWRELPVSIRLSVYAPLWLGFWFVVAPLGMIRLGDSLGFPELLASPYPLLGLVLLIPGVVGMALCVGSFFLQGRGTPAPHDPPARLVTSGPYAYCRNPMLAAQITAGLGEAILLRAWLMLPVLALLFLAVHLRVKWTEEPNLIERFGEEYEEYRRRVPMWIPRLPRPDTDLDSARGEGEGGP